jgi:hypothetical protein
MNIALKRRQSNEKQPLIVDLFEASPVETKLNKTGLLKVMNDTSKHFYFEDGTFMGNMKSKLDMKFSLNWHKENTSNQREFISSVEEFRGEFPLTSNDIRNLKKEYSNG